MIKCIYTHHVNDYQNLEINMAIEIFVRSFSRLDSEVEFNRNSYICRNGALGSSNSYMWGSCTRI